MASRFREKYGIVAPIYVAAILGVLIGVETGLLPSLLNTFLGFLVVLAIPGHLFLAVFMPSFLETNSNSREFPFYLIVIPTLSISIISGVGLFLSMIGEFSREAIVYLVSSACLVGIVHIIYFKEKAKILLDGAYIFLTEIGNINPFRLSKDGVTFPFVFLLASILILSVAVVQEDGDSRELTEIYITGLDGDIESVPTFSEGSTRSFGVIVGVNHKGSDHTFELNEAIYLIEENSSEANVQPEYENRRVIEMMDGQAFETDFHYEMEGNSSYYVEFNLFRNGESEVYRSAYFYVYSSSE